MATIVPGCVLCKALQQTRACRSGVTALVLSCACSGCIPCHKSGHCITKGHRPPVIAEMRSDIVLKLFSRVISMGRSWMAVIESAIQHSLP